MQQRGFTLVELSIVLVIIGLLVGGVMVGQDMIRASQLKAVTTEQDKFTSAAHAFRDKYMGFPGDITNATQFWGAAHATPTTCRQTPTTDTTTCNGDGDKRLGSNNSIANENFAVWKQLGNAGLIEGTFTGTGTPAASYLTPSALTSPTSRIGNNALWTVFNPVGGVITGAAYFQGPTYGNFFVLSQEVGGGSNNQIGNAVMTALEAVSIDGKVDDGMPGQGKVVSNYTNCTTGGANNSDTATARYNSTASTVSCMLFFRDAF